LPTRAAGDASIANKDAAHFLLAKLYLNKGCLKRLMLLDLIFAAADMTKVVSNVTINSSLSIDYWDNF
jgi:hypothetical protein